MSGKESTAIQSYFNNLEDSAPNAILNWHGNSLYIAEILIAIVDRQDKTIVINSAVRIPQCIYTQLNRTATRRGYKIYRESLD